MCIFSSGMLRATGPQEPHPQLLVMGAGLMCSGAMGLPVSGFPNMNAVALEDQTGQNYLTTADFLKVGIAGVLPFTSGHSPARHCAVCLSRENCATCWLLIRAVLHAQGPSRRIV